MPKQTEIVEQLKADVETWVSTFTGLLSDERDMQVRLAIWLSKLGWTVHTEYRVPLPELTGRKGLAFGAKSGDPRFPWPNDISVDIVAERNDEFVALELKYATRPIAEKEKIFSESMLDPDSQILKDQGAADLVMYNYWKDVRRIEALTSAFPALMGGLALIVSNNRTFWQPRDGSPSYIEFATSNGSSIGPGMLRWGYKADTIKQSHPDMELANKYSCRWKPTAMPYRSVSRSADIFHYMIATITK